MMDRDRFDTLAQHVWTKQSRRAALAAVVGAVVMGRAPAPLLAKKAKQKRRATATVADRCFPGKNCVPGAGRNTSRCDFASSTLFRNRDVRGANLSNSNFRGANLRGADFRGANLSRGCFVGADLTVAKLGSSVNLGGAIFCRTIMPDGSVDDSGCEQETACCRIQLRDQSCADAVVNCGIDDGFGFCAEFIGGFGPVGHCYNFPCCGPCGHPDHDYWDALCNQSYPDCNGNCVATDFGTFPCFIGCNFV